MKLHSLSEALLEMVRTIKATKNYSSLNAMVLSGDKYIVACEYQQERVPVDQQADYYRLFYKVEPDGVVVASSGWNQEGWTELPNHTMLVVDRESLEIGLIGI